MRIQVILIILFAGLLLSAQPLWDEDILLAESHYKYWWGSASREEVLYYTWAEESEAGYAIKTQGVGADQSYIWTEPVSQEISNGFPDNVQICAGEDGSVFLYWTNYILPDDMECCLQKISSDGVLLWGAEGSEIELITYQVRFISDNTGGLYFYTQYGNPVLFWHINGSGEIVAGWENGIALGEGNRTEHAVTASGELAIFTWVTEIDEPGRYFQILGGDGSYLYPGEGIYCGDCDSNSAGMIGLATDEYLLAWVYEGNVRGNKLLNNGEFLYPESLYLGNPGDGDHLYKLVYLAGNCYLCLNDSDLETFRFWQYDEAWQSLGTSEDLSYTGILVYNQIKPNGNIMLGDRDYPWFRLIEYNEAGELISPPEEGWLRFDNYNEYFLSGDSEGNTFVTREIIDETGQSDFKAQIFDLESETVFEGEGLLICENKQLEPGNCQIIAMPEKIAYCWNASKNDKIMYKVQYLDNEGNPLLEEEGMTILCRDGSQEEYRVLLKEESSMLLLENYRVGFAEVYTRIHRIVFDDEPWLEWGEDGIVIAGMNWNDVEAVKCEDGSYLLYWQDAGFSRGQLIVDGETVLPDNYDLGLSNGVILSITGDYCTFSSGYGIYLTRWNDNFEPVWDSPVWLAGSTYFEENSFEYIADGDLVKYWISYEGDQMQNYTWRLKKQIITPEGEKLLGVYAPGIYENAEVQIRDFCYIEELDQIILIHGSENAFFMKYMSMEGEILSSEFFTFEDLGGRGVIEIYSEHGYLMVKTAIKEDEGTEMGLCVFDFEGNAVEGLPGAEFYIPDDYFAEIISDDRGIYYAWSEIHLDESYYPMGNGKDIYAQKIDFFANGVEGEQLTQVTSALGIYPNPFNLEVNIRWQLANIISDAGLSIYNIKGQKVREFEVTARNGQITWDGRDASQQQCGSGIYLIRLQNGSEEQTAKVLMLK